MLQNDTIQLSHMHVLHHLCNILQSKVSYCLHTYFLLSHHLPPDKLENGQDSHIVLIYDCCLLTLLFSLQHVSESCFRTACVTDLLQGLILMEIVGEVQNNLGEVQWSTVALNPHGKLGLRTDQSQRRDICM
jgi:hypothetical protein